MGRQFAIGDVQGCHEPLMRLLDKLAFNPHEDTLWFVGDLINRGPDSLKVLRFIHALPKKAKITLGNHDLFLLKTLFCGYKEAPPQTLEAFFNAPDKEELGQWLRQQPLAIYDKTLNLVMTHAGVYPLWDLKTLLSSAKMLENVLQGPHFKDFLNQMFGNQPDFFTPDLQGIDQARFITNALTRMRLCDNKGRLFLNEKENLKQSETPLIPWFLHPKRQKITCDIVFGHWAALEGKVPTPHIYGIDTGCVWGGPLTALNLETKILTQVQGMTRL